ncbi:hypothetical protein BHE74_00020451 [Ensete ventricosum]|nr:hypothetical protein BHE74_00020451 [Ensete ventricosum]
MADGDAVGIDGGGPLTLVPDVERPRPSASITSSLLAPLPPHSSSPSPSLPSPPASSTFATFPTTTPSPPSSTLSSPSSTSPCGRRAELLWIRGRGPSSGWGRREERVWMRAATELPWERWRTCSTLRARVEKEKGRTREEEVEGVATRK